MMITVKNKRWTLLARPRKGEHSIWRLDGDPKGVVYVADCSGGNPDRTEDGPLRLVGDLKIHKGGTSGALITVRVVSEDTTPRGFTMLHPSVALWLVEHEGFKVVIADDDLRTVAKLVEAAK